MRDLTKKRQGNLPFKTKMKETFNDKNGQWQWEPIKGSFCNWLNTWGDEEKHIRYEIENQKAFRRGYHQAIRDVMDKLMMDFKLFDKRTKTGFKR